MDRYEAHILKQQGEYIYAKICGKIAIALNKSHKVDGLTPDFVLNKGIEFTTKSKFCLEKYDKPLWDEVYSIATKEYSLLTEDEQEACRVYINDLDGVTLSDEEIVIDICSEFETSLEQWVFEYVEEEMLYQRMSKKEGNKILYANTRGDSPFPFIDDEDDWDDVESIDEFLDNLDQLRADLDKGDKRHPSASKPKKYHS